MEIKANHTSNPITERNMLKNKAGKHLPVKKTIFEFIQTILNPLILYIQRVY